VSVPDGTERRLRALFDHSSQQMALLSLSGVVLEANRALLELAGVGAAGLIGERFAESPIWHATPASAARVRAAIAEAAAGHSVRHELEIGGGRATLIELTLTPIRGDDGTVSQIIAEGRDVTEARWAERALRISEAKSAGIVSIASDAIITIDESQSILHFNHGAEVIFGYRAEEVLGRPIDLLIPERFRGAHHQHVRNFGNSAVPARRMGERAEILGLRSNGEEFPADASISKLEIGGERIYTVVLRDVSDRKKAERAQQLLAQAGPILATSLDYETTLRSITGLAVPTLADWAIVYVLDRAGAVTRLNYAHADPSRRGLLDALDRYPVTPEHKHPVFQALRTGEPVRLSAISPETLDRMSADAEHRRIYEELGLRSVMILPLVARGRTLGALGFYSLRQAFDDDDLRLAGEVSVRAALAMDNARLYREARDAVQARDDVLAVVSHDLGNPLSAIRIGTTLLLKRRSPEDLGEGWQHLEAIRQSAAQMERLIADLLEVKRLEAGQLALERRAQRPASLIGETVDVLGAVAAERQHEVETSLENDLPAVHADRQRALQVLSNLVGNAIKFTPPGGRIRIAAYRAEDGVCFEVSDTGLGIPEDSLGQVFDRFWQGRKQGRQGIGLGLAIARSIVDAHGGRIWAESVLGAGTTMRFTLPFATAPTAAGAE
jgi:PAS domain S-box-containing protein